MHADVDVCDANDIFETTALSLFSHHRSSDGTLYQLARIKSVGSDKLSKYSCGGANQSASQKSEPHGWTPLYATLSLQAESERWDLFTYSHTDQNNGMTDDIYSTIKINFR
jgi:hypothetical protein